MLDIFKNFVKFLMKWNGFEREISEAIYGRLFENLTEYFFPEILRFSKGILEEIYKNIPRFISEGIPGSSSSDKKSFALMRFKVHKWDFLIDSSEKKKSKKSHEQYFYLGLHRNTNNSLR